MTYKQGRGWRMAMTAIPALLALFVPLLAFTQSGPPPIRRAALYAEPPPVDAWQLLVEAVGDSAGFKGRPEKPPEPREK
jgi:hypothetical protein